MCDSRLASVLPTHFYSDDKRFFATTQLKPCREFNPGAFAPVYAVCALVHEVHEKHRGKMKMSHEKFRFSTCLRIGHVVPRVLATRCFRARNAISIRIHDPVTTVRSAYVASIPARGTGTCVNNYWPSKNDYKYTLLVWPSRYFYKRILYIRTVFM